MSTDELFEKFMLAYGVYYDVSREKAQPPFDAEAVFSAKQEQYFLLHSAKLSEIQSNEYVFFAKRDYLTLEGLRELDARAWEYGLKKVKPNPNHKSSDITLIVIAGAAEESIRKEVRGMRHSKSYRFGFQGYSNYRLAVTETSTGNSCFNRQGDSLKKLVADIYQSKIFQEKERKK
ncbi:MAG: hypothetical protein K6F35_08965 [Lachnospiraceae bacterium]|nr:hypothetical protein [Lachnospiraceae bacterium]